MILTSCDAIVVDLKIEDAVCFSPHLELDSEHL